MLKLVVVALLVAQYLTAGTEPSVKYLTEHVKALTRQVMLQQFFAETRVRTEGQSGLKTTRLRRSGTKNYHVETHTGYNAAAFHDHANNIRTVGMGEFTAVLNGIEFKTRHNDYRLYMPHRTKNDYHAVEPVPLPVVPPSVLQKKTVDEQIAEMREWFKAWRDQDYSQRDYRKYFKPLLCYLEGAWTTPGKNIDEPFKSDRHFIDANSWMELHEKARYVAYSGAKSINENLSFLPTKIMGLINDTIPNFAQWNYRILCHPVKRDIPLERLRVVEDLSSRMMTEYDIFRHTHSRAARFQLNSRDQKKFHERSFSGKQFLDEIMAEIPGKNNYKSFMIDEGLDGAALNPDKSKMDVSKYHRWFRIDGRDAMGTSNVHRGYNDDQLFVARTWHPQVANVDFRKCPNRRDPKSCFTLRQRWSYAIPLELIYLTPLSTWNPYNLNYLGDHSWKTGRVAQANGRNGVCTPGDSKKALNGTTSKLYYITPSAFYSGESVNGKDAADTARGVTCVLDKLGVVKTTRAAGTHVFLPQIKGVGVLRQRYPIFPVHGEGSAVWKELNALREITMNKEKWQRMYWNEKDVDKSQADTELEMGYSSVTTTSRHTHTVEMTSAEMLQVKGGLILTKTTSTENGHSHDVRIRYSPNSKMFYFHQCDGKTQCWDKHARNFKVVTNN